MLVIDILIIVPTLEIASYVTDNVSKALAVDIHTQSLRILLYIL